MSFTEVSLFLIISVVGLYIGCIINPIIYYLPKLTKVWMSNDLQDLIGSPVVHEKIVIGDSEERATCKHCNQKNSTTYKLSLFNLIIHRAKCEHCGKLANVALALVEITCCIVTLATINLFGYEPYTVLALLFSYSVIIVVFTDLEHHLVPNTIIMPLIWLGLALSVTGYSKLTPNEAILGAILGYLAMWLLAKVCQILSKTESMGKGDFKIMAAFGVWVGPDLIQISLLFSFLIPAIYLLITRKGKKQQIAFGPYIVLGWALAIFYSNLDLSAHYFWFI